MTIVKFECRCRDEALQAVMGSPVYHKGKKVGNLWRCIACQYRVLEIQQPKADPIPKWLKRVKGLKPTQFNKIIFRDSN